MKVIKDFSININADGRTDIRTCLYCKKTRFWRAYKNRYVSKLHVGEILNLCLNPTTFIHQQHDTCYCISTISNNAKSIAQQLSIVTIFSILAAPSRLLYLLCSLVIRPLYWKLPTPKHTKTMTTRISNISL